MAIFLSILFLLITSTSACERCVHQSKAGFFSQNSALSSGACGYGSKASEFNSGHLAAAVPLLYNDGAGCGACFQMRCKNPQLCATKGTTVIVTDLNTNNQSEFILSSKAFMAMANEGMGQNLLKLGVVDVDYKRIPCQIKNKNLAVRVEESSQWPFYLAIKLLYQGGQTEVLTIDVAEVGTSVDWIFMHRKSGAVWFTSGVPRGARLQFRFMVTSGHDIKYVHARSVLPLDWKVGVVYDTEIQIDDIALENCYPCDSESWK